MAFTVSRGTALAPEVAWSAVTDLAEHARDVPLTEVQVAEGEELELEVQPLSAEALEKALEEEN